MLRVSLLIRAVWIETPCQLILWPHEVGRCSYEQCGLKRFLADKSNHRLGRCSYEQCGLKLLIALNLEKLERVAAHTSSVD